MKNHIDKVTMPAPTRGIIVVDTNALLTMSVPLSNKFLTDEKKDETLRLTDALIFLAQHGYEVIIPEMTANLCGGFMRDGASIGDYFKRDGEHSSSPNSKHYLLTESFFRTLRAHQLAGANIRIEPPTHKDQSLEAQHLRNLWRIHNLKNCSYYSNFDLDLEKRSAIRGAYSNFKASPRCNERAIESCILNIKEPQVPIFYLTGNQEAGERIEAQCNGVSAVNFLGIYNALAEKSLLNELGLENCPFISLANFTHAELTSRQFYLSDPFILKDGSSHHPFAKSLAGLREEINADNPDLPLVTLVSPVERFRAKYSGNDNSRAHRTFK